MRPNEVLHISRDRRRVASRRSGSHTVKSDVHRCPSTPTVDDHGNSRAFQCGAASYRLHYDAPWPCLRSRFSASRRSIGREAPHRGICTECSGLRKKHSIPRRSHSLWGSRSCASMGSPRDLDLDAVTPVDHVRCRDPDAKAGHDTCRRPRRPVRAGRRARAGTDGARRKNSPSLRLDILFLCHPGSAFARGLTTGISETGR